MQIDMWSDLVCPWCFIGKRQLEIALEQFEYRDQVTISHRAYQLNPSAEFTTTPTTQMLADKYGISLDQAKEMQSNIVQAAATVGLNFDLGRSLSGNTRDGHRLVLWAQALDQDRGQELLEVLMNAYFEKGESIFGREILASFAAQAGIDPSQALAMLEGTEFIDLVHRDQQIAQTLGCAGVPFFVLDEKFRVSGAQSSELFLSALQQAWDASTSSTP
jgi:predicted DsbA family dithiol-disulfide isomerase